MSIVQFQTPLNQLPNALTFDLEPCTKPNRSGNCTLKGYDPNHLYLQKSIVEPFPNLHQMPLPNQFEFSPQDLKEILRPIHHMEDFLLSTA